MDALAVFAAAYVLDGVDVSNYWIAILVAVSLSILNTIVKPLMVILTIPATIVSFGLFLFVINAAIILLADWVVEGFEVDGFWYALLFSLILTLFKSILNAMIKEDKPSQQPNTWDK